MKNLDFLLCAILERNFEQNFRVSTKAYALYYITENLAWFQSSDKKLLSTKRVIHKSHGQFLEIFYPLHLSGPFYKISSLPFFHVHVVMDEPQNQNYVEIFHSKNN